MASCDEVASCDEMTPRNEAAISVMILLYTMLDPWATPFT